MGSTYASIKITFFYFIHTFSFGYTKNIVFLTITYKQLSTKNDDIS